MTLWCRAMWCYLGEALGVVVLEEPAVLQPDTFQDNIRPGGGVYGGELQRVAARQVELGVQGAAGDDGEVCPCLGFEALPVLPPDREPENTNPHMTAPGGSEPLRWNGCGGAERGHPGGVRAHRDRMSCPPPTICIPHCGLPGDNATWI